MALPRSVETLVRELSRFPGIGRRSAERIAFDLIGAPPERRDALSAAIGAIGTVIGVCPDCGYFTEDGRCLVCLPERHQDTILVVEKQMEILAIDKAGGYRGLYHVLGGHLSPLKGIGPADLRIEELLHRLATLPVRELILALEPSVEGDATSLYLAREVEREGLRITRLGRGVPMGSSLEFSDAGTLRLALDGRRTLEE